MNKNQHTPGPWIGGSTITAIDPDRAPGSYDQITIAQRVNRPADQKLIVSAPTLAAIVRELATEDDCGLSPSLKRLIFAAREACK